MLRCYVVQFRSYGSLFPRAPYPKGLASLKRACLRHSRGSRSLRHVRKSRSALILLVLLFFSFSLAVPAEDLPETAYDESEASPYQGTPLISNLISQVATSATGAVESRVGPRSGTSYRFAARITDRDSRQFAEGRIVRALLCTLLC